MTYQLSSIIDVILFADDTNIFISDKCLTKSESRVDTEIQKISRWLKINKLSLNIKKRNYIIFKSNQKLINYKLNIKIDNIEIEQVCSVSRLVKTIMLRDESIRSNIDSTRYTKTAR